jgi:hypothetical protein
MPDTATPLTGDVGDFEYTIDKGGNLMIDGQQAGKVNRPETVEPEEAPVEDKEDEVPEPEKAAEPAEEKAAVETPATTKEPTLPDRVKLKIKVYGEESEREFTKEELVAQVQKGLAAEKRFQEVSEKERAIEPFLHIKDSPEFKEWLNNMVQENPSLAPVAPPPPSPEDVMGYRLRREEPGSADIVEAMKDWQATLPVYEAKALENNHRVFNMAFDRFKAARQTKTASPSEPATPPTPKPEPKPIQDKEAAEKVIAAKERQKESARTLPPSVSAEERSEVKAKQKQEADLRRRVRSGDRNAEFALAALLYGDMLDEPR